MRAVAIAFFLALSEAALAGVTAIRAVETPNSLEGFVTNDITIDFDGQLSGQQVVVSLRAGSVFYSPVGTFEPPNPLLFPTLPNLEYSTFVTLGGWTSDDAERLILLGGAPNLPGDANLLFGESTINAPWAPAPGVVIENQTDYPVMRLTLSDDAEGEVWYFGATRDGEPLIAAPGGNYPVGTITNGCLASACVPEPSALLLSLLSIGSQLMLRQR